MRMQIKRVYEPPAPADRYRILVDRLWPRGLSKERAAVDEWLREVAPSAALRRWFGHEPARWAEFKRRYFQELRAEPGRDCSRALANTGRAPANDPTLRGAGRSAQQCRRTQGASWAASAGETYGSA